MTDTIGPFRRVVAPDPNNGIRGDRVRPQLFNELQRAIEVLDARPTGTLEFDVRRQGADGDGTTDDTVDIDDTMVLAADAITTADQRVVLALAPGKTHKVSKRVSGNQTAGTIRIDPGVNLDGQGAILLLNDNVNFITNHWPTLTSDNDYSDVPPGNSIGSVETVITADVDINDTQYTVTSTADFTAGDEVHLRLGDNPWDSAETSFTMFATVLSIDSGTTMTLDRPTPVAVVAADTETRNRNIVKLHRSYDGSYIRDLSMINPQTGSANAESGIDLRYARNMVIENITGEHNGAGTILLAYCENIALRDIRLRHSDSQSGHTAKGRLLNFWNVKNILAENLYCEDFESTAGFFESACRGVVIDGWYINNTHPTRTNATQPIFQVAQGSDVHFRNVLIEGNGGMPIVETGSSDAEYSFTDLTINTSTQIKSLDLSKCFGTLRIGLNTYNQTVTRTIPFRVVGGTAVEINLPSGLYRRMKFYITSETGITNVGGGIYINNGSGGVLDIGPLSTPGVLTTIGFASFYGSDYSFNNVNTKQLQIYSDATVPVGTHGFIELEYWPSGADDGSKGRLEMALLNPPTYTTSNVTADRTFDANSTTLDEVADVLGTLIADLKQSGWIA